MQFSPGGSPLAGSEKLIRNQSLAQVLLAQEAMKNIVIWSFRIYGEQKTRPDPVPDPVVTLCLDHVPRVLRGQAAQLLYQSFDRLSPRRVNVDSRPQVQRSSSGLKLVARAKRTVLRLAPDLPT